MKIRRSRSLALSSPLIAVTVGVLCLAFYIQTSYSASIPTSSSSTTTTSKKPSKAPSTSVKTKTPKPRLEVQAGRMKASDIKACISKAFCEVNSASDKPNYAVNQEFFDLMNRINALSDEELDSGSTSVEYDDDEDEEEEDDDAGSSEESSRERIRGYPPPRGYGGRYGRNMLKNETNVEGELNFSGNGTASTPSTIKKVKDLKKKGKKGKRTNKKKGKLGKKYVNGTYIAVPKRRGARFETDEEKAEKDAYVVRKQREMGQVNDLAALIRISADIGLTLRSPRKCRTLFNKCTMSHDQIVDLFNQTLMAVTTPQSGTSSVDPMSTSAGFSAPTTKKAKVPTTATTTLESEPISTVILDNNIIVRSTPTPTQTTVTTQTPTTITPEDVNRSSKSRHEFSDEDVEYMTDTEIAPVHTYALFVNDAPEENVKTQEEVTNVQETFKKYANAFPAETPLSGNLPSLRKRSNKKTLKKVGGNGRSSQSKSALRRRKHSSEEEDEEEDDDAEASTSIENNKSGFRLEDPYPGYRVQEDDEKDADPEAEDDDAESAEPVSNAKESNEGILPPLVQKERPKMKEEDDEDEEDEPESDESMDADESEGKGFGGKQGKIKSSSVKGTKGTSKPDKEVTPQDDDEESSEEDEVEAEQPADDQVPPPWTPVYQMYMHEKTKQGHKKKQKGPYKGGEGPYADELPAHGHGHSHSHGGLTGSTSAKKPWGGSSASVELPGALPSSHSHSHEGVYGDAPYHHQSHGPAGHYGAGGPLPGSQETGGTSEQKPGFFQSILSWFSGGSKSPEPPGSHQVDSPYGSPSSHLPYGASGSPGSHSPYGAHSGSHEHSIHKPHSSAGSPWPSQPDPAGVGHFGQGYRYRYRNPDASSEEESIEEVLEEEPVKLKKKNKKRRYNGRSDSIIAAPPKKSSQNQKKKSTAGITKNGPPPPVVIMPKKGKSVGKSNGATEFDKLVQADGDLSSSNGNSEKKATATSDNEAKRTKKAAVKPKKKQQKQTERATPPRKASRESAEDDDEAFSSEELYNQQVAKLKTGGATLGGGSSSNSNTNGGASSSGPSGNSGKPTRSSHENQKQSNGNSFPSYFESMFGTKEKDKFNIKGKDDGGLLYGFDTLSSTLNAAPLDVTITNANKKPSSYKVNRNKKKQKKGNAPPVKFENKEVLESSEEEEKKK